jgi:hypothetical protein
MRMLLSLILRGLLLEFGQNNFVFVGLLKPFVSVNSDFFKFFAAIGTLKIIKNIDFLTRMLRPLCAH